MGKATFGKASKPRSVIGENIFISEPVYVDRPVEVNIPIEVVREVPVETVIYKDIEKIIYVDKPIEVIKEVEKIIYKDNFIDRIVHVDRPIEVVKQVVVHDISHVLAEKVRTANMEVHVKKWRLAAVVFLSLNVIGGALCLLLR